MKKLATTALAAVMAVSLVGCGGTSSTGGSKKNTNILRMGLSGIEGTFAPMGADTTYDQWVVDLMFEGLVTNDAEGNFIPKLADWTLSDDKLTYTFTLKDGITFWDGNPLTANDVAFTYNITKEEDYTGPRTDVGAAIADIKVIDDKTVAFTMKEASPANIGLFGYGIMEEAHYKHSSYEELTQFNDDPMGSGPFKFDSWASKQYVNLVKNDKYWDKDNVAKIDGVTFTEVSEDTILSALQNGEIDICQPAAKAENVEAIKSMDNAKLIAYLGNGYTYMAFNVTPADASLQYHHSSALADVRVRQALLYGLDRKSFIQAEYGSDELASVGMAPISPISWAYPDPSALNAYDYNPEKATQLLTEAGWSDTDGDGILDKDGEKLELSWLVYTDSTWPGTLSSMAIDSWGKLGIKLNVIQMDFNTVASTVNDSAPGKKDFDIYTMGWSLSIDPDPTGGIYDADAYAAGGFNATGFRDDKSQELMKAAKTEFDQAKRADLYKEWAVRQNELVPTAVVAYRNEIWGISNRVHGLEDINAYQYFPVFATKVTLD